MLRAVLNKSWRQHPTRLQLYGHLPPITKTIQVRRTRHAGHCWRSKDELISDVLLWTPTHGCARVGRPARTYIQQLCEDTGCNPEDLPEAMNDREKWRQRVRDIRAGGATWWWWWKDVLVYILGIVGSSCSPVVSLSFFPETFCGIQAIGIIFFYLCSQEFSSWINTLLIYYCWGWSLFVVFPFLIPSQIFASFKHLISFKARPSLDGRDYFRPESMFSIWARCF